MSDELKQEASGQGGEATSCAPYAPTVCSKSESATPLTDALFAKCKARPTDGSGSRDGGWNQQDIADFLRHSRKLEIALGIATAALREISVARAAMEIPLYARPFELLDRIQGIASVALDTSTLNPVVRGATESRTSPPRCSHS